ncbi:MAG: transcriptional regulator [Deltaproteobacteria bacterium RIFCSPLOWO2_02_FULL_44_10]|nr:MAG: transcriptional regulator [Deltaproteobacteria bacterium RIFCSPHIGHO2_02_FULL_44_16]OGQ45528.1 MAG: transcriptional regulator [Deltaproteobacteria bacterium RIFCSPLOWO2_02_FULL_44_10]
MKKILLIEDDSVLRENTAEILTLAQYQVTTAKQGKEGIQKAKEMKPDVILCDIMMPELDGYGVLHILSKDPETASIPFLFLTAKAEKSDLRKGMELGADDYLTKPFDETELLNAIETRLKKRAFAEKTFTATLEGLHEFLDQARGMKELATLSEERPLVRYRPQETIFHEGEIPAHLYFLQEGKVKTCRMHDEGKELVTNLYSAGNFFGYTALLEEIPYTDTAVTLEAAKICKIPKEDFFSLISKNRDVAQTFIKMLSNSVRETETRLLSLAYDSVRKRVAETLLMAQKKYHIDGERQTKLPLTRENLANMVGTATETLIRCLSDFKDEKLISIDGRQIIILNVKGLKELQ